VGLFDDWGQVATVTIDKDKVPSNLTNFPVHIPKSVLPDSMFDADGSNPALNGGGDIRFTPDAAGTARLAVEVVFFVTDNDPANGEAELTVKVPSISSSVDTLIYLWFNKAAQSQPARDAAFGIEAAWNNGYVLVQRFNQSPGAGAPQLIDSTASNFDGTATAAGATLVDGAVGKAWDLPSASQVRLSHTTDSALAFERTDPFTFEMVLADDATPGFAFLMTRNRSSTPFRGYQMSQHSGKIYFLLQNDNSPLNAFEMEGNTNFLLDGNPHYITCTYDGSQVIGGMNIFKDGIVDTPYNIITNNLSGTIVFTPAPNFYICGEGRNIEHYDGPVSEARVSSVERSADWVATTQETLMAPGTFVSVGVPSYPDVIGSRFRRGLEFGMRLGVR